MNSCVENGGVGNRRNLWLEIWDPGPTWHQNRGFWPDATEPPDVRKKNSVSSTPPQKKDPPKNRSLYVYLCIYARNRPLARTKIPMSSRGPASWSRIAFVYRFVLSMPDSPCGLEKSHVRKKSRFRHTDAFLILPPGVRKISRTLARIGVANLPKYGFNTQKPI